MRSVNVVDVEPAPQRRRWWSVAEKIRLVEETPGMAVSCVARTHGLSPILLFKWRHRQAAGRRAAVRVDDEVIGATRVRQFEERTRALERLLGRKTLEVAILKEALAAARAKEPLLRWPSHDPDVSMKAIADALQVARLNLAERTKRGRSRPRPLSRPATPSCWCASGRGSVARPQAA